jgi:hypothetical protein
MTNDVNSADKDKSTGSSQLQTCKIPIKEEINDDNFLLPVHITKPIVFLTLVIMLLNLLVIAIPSCDEVTVRFNFWEFNYQLIKKSDCSILRHE